MNSTKSGPTAPILIYAITAIVCWLVPLEIRLDDDEFIISAYPTHALALAAGALAAD